MGIMYFLHANVNLDYTEEGVNHVLKKFHEYGCVYLAQTEDAHLSRGSYFLTAEQAASKLLTATKEARYFCEDTLILKYNDTYFDLRLYKEKNNLICLSAFDFPCPWGKNFWYGKKTFLIDFARYINLIIDITSDLALLSLEMSSDHSKEWIKGVNKKGIASAIDMGSLKELFSGNTEGVRGSLNCIIRNGIQNGFTFFDENTKQHIEPSAQKCYAVLKADFPVYLYATKDDVPFKIEIKKNNDDMYDFVSVYPLEPYLMKKGYGNDEKKIDIAFYVQCLIELCENFAIYELKSFL